MLNLLCNMLFSSCLAAQQDLIDSRITLCKFHEVNTFQGITVIEKCMLVIILALIMLGGGGSKVVQKCLYKHL